MELSQESFARRLHTKFRVRAAAAPRPVELELVEVKGWDSRPGEQAGMERFSAFFDGPPDILLPQQTYTLDHDEAGALEIFLVPVARDARAARYEAVFNFAK